MGNDGFFQLLLLLWINIKKKYSCRIEFNQWASHYCVQRTISQIFGGCRNFVPECSASPVKNKSDNGKQMFLFVCVERREEPCFFFYISFFFYYQPWACIFFLPPNTNRTFWFKIYFYFYYYSLISQHLYYWDCFAWARLSFMPLQLLIG